MFYMKSQNRIPSLNNLYCIRTQQTESTILIYSYEQYKSVMAEEKTHNATYCEYNGQ